MKIYFSGSRFFKKDYEKRYSEIIDVLKKGYGVVYDSSASVAVPMGYKMPEEKKKELYKRMEKGMDRSDICVFEASYPSTIHIGHEITLASTKGKPSIVFYLKDREPILFKGLDNIKIIWVEYGKDEDVKQKVIDAVEEAKKLIDVRFNFFVSPKILAYLDWVAKTKRVPRSVFLRNLIEREMKKDKQFKD